MPWKAFAAAVIVGLLVAAACGGGGASAPTATPSPTPGVTPEASPFIPSPTETDTPVGPTPTPTPSPTGGVAPVAPTPTPTPSPTAGAAPVVLTPLPSPEPYQAPHQNPGPATDRIIFRAIHQDIAAGSLKAGDIDLYDFSLKTEAARGLQGVKGVRIYEAPATSFSLILNPAPAPEGELNPFSIREVRQAIQHVINRDFIAQEIFKGLAQPMVTHVSPFDFDYLTVADLIQEFDITYDPELARELVTEAMTKAGAELVDGRWRFNGKPVQIKFIVRVEDERREIGDLIRAELEKLGFTVAPIYHQFAPAILNVYGTDPQQFQWHMYTEGWGRGAAERYDYATINQMVAPWLGNMPGWQEVGFWQYTNDRLDDLGQRIFRGDFKDAQERAELYKELTSLSLDESVRIWIATAVNSFPATSELRGVTEDIVAGPKSLYALREAYIPGKDTITVGNQWVWTERTTWNPVGGFGDVYSVDIWRNVFDPPLARHPFTGIPIPFRATYEVETAGPSGRMTLPADAFRWDAEADAFRDVDAGTTAISKVTFDYSKYFGSNWHHGQPITMADVIYSIFQSFDIAFDEDKSRIEFSIATTSKPFLDTIKGFRIVGDNKLEVYADYWHFVPDFIAEYASVPGLSMPWEMLAAMDDLVFVQRRAAYTDTAAQRSNVDWLNLVLDRHTRLVRRTLLGFQDTGQYPANVFQVGGRSLVSPEEAQQRYAAALAWIKAHGIAVISNGPFKLVRFDPPAQFAELEAFRDPTYPFKPGDKFFGSINPVNVVDIQSGPVAIGSEATVEVQLQGPGQLGLRFRLFDPVGGKVVTSGDAERTGPNSFRISLSSRLTSQLPPGLYNLFVTAFSDEVSAVSERKVNLEVG